MPFSFPGIRRPESQKYIINCYYTYTQCVFNVTLHLVLWALFSLWMAYGTLGWAIRSIRTKDSMTNGQNHYSKDVCHCDRVIEHSFRFSKPLSKSGPVEDMPVPASYNDVPAEKTPKHRSDNRTFRKFSLIATVFSVMQGSRRVGLVRPRLPHAPVVAVGRGQEGQAQGGQRKVHRTRVDQRTGGD